MLSADALTSDLVEFSKAAAGSVGGGYTPAEIRTAYGFNNVSFGSTAANGAGQTIAIIDAYNDPNIASDLATFDAQFGIAAPASLKVVNQSGGSNLPGTDSSGGWEVETALDVEWAHAIAPAANILLVEANNDSDSNLFGAVNYAREQAGVSVISMSWGSDDNAVYASSDQSLAAQYLVTPAGHQGITFVAAAGDTGVAEFPSTSPNVLAVGGTDLYLNSSGSISSETYWTPQTIDGVAYSGGGGVSKEFSGRVVPDVSYDAGVSYDVYDSFSGGGGWITVGGTSAGSPQWAGLVAVADQGRVLAGQTTLNGATQTISALHSASSSDFNTITGGTTDTTGLGSPKANLLIPYLASYGSSTTTPTPTPTAPAAPASASAAAGSSSSVTVTWSTSTGATGYDLYEVENGKDVLISTYAAGTTSAVVNGLSASTSYTFQVAAYNSGGTSGAVSAQVTTPAAAVTVTAPQSFKVSATSSTTATLSWQAVSGATGYQVYQWNGSVGVLIGNLPAGSSSLNVSGLAAGSTQYFYVSAYNATSSASTAWVSVVMPAAATTSTLTAPVLTATATSNTTGRLSWTASPGATGYDIYYMKGGQTASLGSVGGGTTAVSISGMAPGTTYEFLVLAYNSTSQASSKWTMLTTSGTASTSRAAAVDALADLTMVADASSTASAEASLGLLPAGVTFTQAAASNQTNSSISNGLSASVFSPAAVDSVVRAALSSTAGIHGTAAGGNSAAGDSFLDDTSDLSVDAIPADSLGTLGRQNYGLSRSWSSFAANAPADKTAPTDETASADHETSFRRSLVESLDTLFGRDIEWTESRTGAAHGESSTGAVAESGVMAGSSESEQPSVAALAVGLALSALWSEGERRNQSAEPEQSSLKRRQISS
jgi:subtilase family serine protease